MHGATNDPKPAMRATNIVTSTMNYVLKSSTKINFMNYQIFYMSFIREKFKKNVRRI